MAAISLKMAEVVLNSWSLIKAHNLANFEPSEIKILLHGLKIALQATFATTKPFCYFLNFICLWHFYNLFTTYIHTTCSLLAYYVFKTCSEFFHNLFLTCLQFVHVMFIGEGLTKNVKLGLLAEPPTLLTWAPVSCNIVVFEDFKVIFKH